MRVVSRFFRGVAWSVLAVTSTAPGLLVGVVVSDKFSLNLINPITILAVPASCLIIMALIIAVAARH